MRGRCDIVVVGGGHNGLVAATLLARAGRSVTLLERSPGLGGAVASAQPFPGVPARLSRYSYLVSLFPPGLLRELGVRVALRERAVPWYVPGVSGTGERLPTSLLAMFAGIRDRLLGTLTQPLLDRSEFRTLLEDDAAWEALFERPLSELLLNLPVSDALRGLVATDGLIGTFASLDDPALLANRCLLYHVIGGPWKVPVGGMGALSDGLTRAAQAAGAELRTGCEVVSVSSDGRGATVGCEDGSELECDHLLAGVAPSVLARLMGAAAGDPAPEGSQLKLNLLLSRLPAIREPGVRAEDAFRGTFHVNESYEQLQAAYREAAGGGIPSLPPCEMYCHSLTDPSVLAPSLREAGAHAVTVFALHMPARLFAGAADAGGAAELKAGAVEAVLRSIDSVLAEPLSDCLATDAGGRPCLEAVTPPELEAQLAMPAGHIFHRDLAWPFAESPEDVGRWGVETPWPNVWLCGAGARRGGGVSGIPGHNAAMAVLGRSRGVC